MPGLVLAPLALWALAFLLTGEAGGVFYPLVFHGHLHPSLWGAFAVGAVPSAALLARPLRRRVTKLFFPAAFTVVVAIGGVLALVLAADVQRSIAIARFAPDRSQGQGFLRSLRTAPRDFQVILHAAMLKDCTAFGWSYRNLAPYAIPEGATANVAPPDWFAPGSRCGPVAN